MNTFSAIINGVPTEITDMLVEVEQIPLPPENGWECSKPGKATYTVTTDSVTFTSNDKPLCYKLADGRTVFEWGAHA